MRGCIGYYFDGSLNQLIVALHPLVLFIAMCLTSEDAGYDWEVMGGGGGGGGTECIVCVSGYDPLTFLSCPFPLFVLFWLGGSFMAPII